MWCAVAQKETHWNLWQKVHKKGQMKQFAWQRWPDEFMGNEKQTDLVKMKGNKCWSPKVEELQILGFAPLMRQHSF